MTLIKTPMYTFYFFLNQAIYLQISLFQNTFPYVHKGSNTNTKFVYNMGTNVWNRKNMALLYI